MGTEIERKFLTTTVDFLKEQQGTEYKQGYLNREGCTVRVRIAGKQAFLTIKGKTVGLSRAEFEYSIPVGDAEEMLATLCALPPVEKTRYLINHADKCWEVDVFHGANQGLVVAEIELEHEEERFEHPPWLGAEVSDDPRYFNSQLASAPFSSWKESQQ